MALLHEDDAAPANKLLSWMPEKPAKLDSEETSPKSLSTGWKPQPAKAS